MNVYHSHSNDAVTIYNQRFIDMLNSHVETSYLDVMLMMMLMLMLTLILPLSRREFARTRARDMRARP